MTPEISIIVPFYKVEQYICECLDAIQSQTYRDWECILVDDGSPDRSGEICDEYARKDSRFRVVHCENGGVSAARNMGLKLSRGKYIGFVDSDDVPHARLFERLRDLLISHDADVAQVSYESIFTTFSRKKHLVDKVVVYDRVQVAKGLLYGGHIPNYLWIKLFRREVIDSPFPEGRVFEDMHANARWTRNIHRMVLSPEVLYSYRCRKGSIVNSNYVENRIDYLKAVDVVIKTLREIEPEVITQQFTEKFWWEGMIVAGKNIARHVEDPASRLEPVNKISQLCRRLPDPTKKSLGLKKWMRARLLLNRPSTFIWLMRLTYGLNLHRHHSDTCQFD